MKFLFIFLLFISLHMVISATGQNLPTVLNSAGSSTSNAGLFVESNFGEAFVGQSTSGNYLLLTHGFLQPNGGITQTPPPIPSLPANNWYDGLDNSGNSVTVNNILLENTFGEWMTTSRTGGNYLLTQGILQPHLPINNSPLPVTGLEFFVKRLDKLQVQLDWKTLQEIKNKGFHIERKKENENSFTALKFIPSKGLNGNSSFPLTYLQLDTNNYAGKTYYRLKQEDHDGKFVYSVIRVISGDAEKMVSLKAWPIPAPKEFSVQVSGIEKDVLLLYDMNGRLVKQLPVTNGEVIKIDNLVAGAYLIKLKDQKDIFQRVIIQ